MTHVMIDLETMGNTPDAPIVAIGACLFSFEGGVGSTFYSTCTLESAVESGAKMDPSTVIWWMQQSPDAQKEIVDARGDLWEALSYFTQWLPDEIEGVWGNGATFDNVILAQTFRRFGQPVPWAFWLDRCYRTVKAASDIEMSRRGTHHNALDDAISQAEHLVAIWAAQ